MTVISNELARLGGCMRNLHHLIKGLDHTNGRQALKQRKNIKSPFFLVIYNRAFQQTSFDAYLSFDVLDLFVI